MGFFFLRYCAIVAAVAAAGYSLILARAAYLFACDTRTSVPAAVQLIPYNSVYVARLAAWMPAERNQLLHRAVKLNPWDFQSWIQLGLATEMEHNDAEGAERQYLHAATVDRMFLPRWTLTNFYFRHRRPSTANHSLFVRSDFCADVARQPGRRQNCRGDSRPRARVAAIRLVPFERAAVRDYSTRDSAINRARGKCGPAVVGA
jgi:hypothetical protein